MHGRPRRARKMQWRGIDRDDEIERRHVARGIAPIAQPPGQILDDAGAAIELARGITDLQAVERDTVCPSASTRSPSPVGISRDPNTEICSHPRVDNPGR